MPTSNGQGDPEGHGAAEQTTPGEELRAEGTDDAVVETVECPHCGRRFVGDYCPDCGQEANPSVSATGVVGGFFRELVDVERGFWPTLIELTLRPGDTLQRFLRGVRTGLASPGRYLLAVVLFNIVVARLLRWTGVRTPYPDSSSKGQGIREAFDAAFGQLDVVFEGQAIIIVYILLIGPLAALLYRLFEDQFDHMAEALAIGCFLVAHASLLAISPGLIYQLPAFLYVGYPIEDAPLILLSFGIYLGYIGFACYGCFDPGWWATLKGMFAWAWSALEMFSVLFASTFGYAAWLIWAHPGRFGLTATLNSAGKTALNSLLVGLLFLLPVLLHAGLEVYSRLR